MLLQLAELVTPMVLFIYQMHFLNDSSMVMSWVFMVRDKYMFFMEEGKNLVEFTLYHVSIVPQFDFMQGMCLEVKLVGVTFCCQ